MKLGLVLSLLIFISGCSTTKKENIQNYENIPSQDFIDHYKFLGSNYLSSSNVKEIQLSENSKKYLKNIYNRLITNNEILFQRDEVFNFHVVEDKSPFLFSLPGGDVFYSTGLFEKYLKSEEVFIASLSAEIVRSKKNIYEKKIIIPLGFMSTEKMLQLTRVDFKTKKNINEWSFLVLKRSGYDGSSYLNWIQVQNRNSLDFALYLGDSIGISNEEQAFKNFMAKQGVLGFEKKLNEANSSKDYYQLLKNIISKGKNETGTIRKNSSRRII